MKIPDKALCKLSKDQIAALLPKLAAELPDSRYLCRKCGRAAVEKWRLCKPQAIAKLLATAGDERHADRREEPSHDEDVAAPNPVPPIAGPDEPRSEWI